jgi:glyoxylase-like metal-dependent hydrolase (beta-lactamase superfamily II)
MRMKPENDAWQPIPGDSLVRLMPLERPSSAGSMVYLLEYPELFLLVDLGMDEERIAVAAHAMNGADPGHVKPVLVILTHCHIDHIAAAPALAGVHPRPFTVSGHSACRAILARQDPVPTLSYLFRCVPPPIEIVTPLFSHDGFPLRTGGSPPALSLTESVIDPALGLAVQDIAVAERLICRAYATPGHTACGICLQIGNILFCGDLPFAGNPGVAGTPGWNRRELISSLDAITRLIQEGDNLLVCSGHGPIMTRETALAQFKATGTQAGRIKALSVLDAGRSAFLKTYARTLLHELTSTLTIIAGRLLLVAEQLETLEEPERSRAIRESSVLDALDQLIDQYARSAGREDRAGEPETRIPLIAGSILAKLDKMLGDRFFTGIIDAIRLRRARNLILDFKNALLGIPFRDLLRAEEPASLVRSLLDELTARPFEDAALMAAADDHKAFVDELMRRMALRPLFGDVCFCSSVPEELPLVAVERGHLLDTLIGLCELLVVSGGNRIMIDAAAVGEEVRLTLSTAAPAGPDILSERKVEFYSTTLQLYGARFAVQTEAGRLALEIFLPVAEWFEKPVI